MAGALFSRLNRSFGAPPGITERRTGALQKIETVAAHYPLQLETLAEIAPQMAEKSVVVIGAGLAGLTAAWWLATHGFQVAALEARDRIGGRVHTVIAKNGRVLECGGELIGRNHANWLRLARYFGLGLSPITTEENYAAASLKSPMLLGGATVSVAEQETLYDEMKEALKTLDPLAAKVDAWTPWLSHHKPKDHESVADWLNTLRLSVRTRAALRFQLECDQTIPVEEQSLLGLLAAVRGGSLTDLSDPRREEPSEFWTETEVYRCTGGNLRLAQSLKAEIEEQGGQVFLSTPVTKIKLDPTSDVSVTAGGKEFRAQWVVVAVPPSCWDQIEFPFATDRYRISMGSAYKFLADTKKRFWMRDSLSPNGTDDRFGMVWEGTDNEDASQGDPELTVFAGGPAADAAYRASDPEEHFRDGLERLYNGFKNEVGDTIGVPWNKEQWTGAGYSCPTKGQVTTAAERLYKPYERLVWAGEHTCMAFFGYMESALQSGMHAAQLIAQQEGIPEVQRICEVRLRSAG